MNAEIVHVTDHAWVRWRERAVASDAECSAAEIIQAVRESRQLKKDEPLPYRMPRISGSIYTVKDDIMFILESVTKTEFRLVTVITEMPRKLPILAKTKKQRREREKQLAQAQLEVFNQDIKFTSATEQRDALVKEKERWEGMIVITPKKSRTQLVTQLQGIEQKLTENRPLWVAEKEKEYHDAMKSQLDERNQTFKEILVELKAIHELLKEPPKEEPKLKPKPKPKELSAFSFADPIVVDRKPTTLDIMRSVFANV